MLLIAVSACKNNDEVILKGKFENAAGLQKVALYKGDQLVDSVILNENGEFKFAFISPETDFYYLSAAQKTYPLIAKNGDQIGFKADFSNEAGEYELSGSDDSEKLKDFNKISAKYSKVYMDIQQEYQEKVSQNPLIKDSIEAVLIPRFEQNMDAFAKETIAFTNKNRDNLAGFYVIQVTHGQDTAFFNGHIPVIPGVAGAIDYFTIFNQDIGPLGGGRSSQ